MPLQVSQQVLALHPITREPRTGVLLSTYASKYHVQFHNSDLSVYLLKDIEITPIGLNDFYQQDMNVYKTYMQVTNQQKL